MVRIDEATGSGVALSHRLQRPIRQARPVRRRAAGAGRGLPQRRRDRRDAAGRDQLPELRLPGGPRGHVAVRRGRRAAWPTGAWSWASRSPAATCRFYNQTGDDGDPARPRSSACSASSTTWSAHADGVGRRRRAHLPAGRHRATSSPAPSGPHTCTATSAGCRRRWTSTASGCSPRSWSPASRDGHADGRARRVRRGRRAVRSPRWRCARATGARCWVPDGVDPFVFLFSESPARRRRRPAQRGAAVHRDVRGSGCAGRADRRR